MEYELLDTGVFDDNRYFDVVVEYAKAAPDDILIRLTIANRGPEAARLHVLPTLWFRNTWSAGENGTKPGIRLADGDGDVVFHASHDDLGDRYLYCADRPAPLFTDNETNRQRIFNQPNPTP